MDIQFIGTGLAIGLAGLGVAAGQGFLIYKVMGLIGRNPRMSSFFLMGAILGVALVESAAIYGLVVAMQLMSETMKFAEPLAAVGAGLAIGLTGLGVGIGEGILIAKGLEATDMNPENRTKILSLMVLFVALVESSAIYGLVIALQILGDANTISGFAAVGASLAIGLTGLGVGIGEGMLAQQTLFEIGKDDKKTKLLLPFSILAIALIESSAIYGLIIALKSLSSSAGIALIGSGLAIGLAGLGVSLGEANLLKKGVQVLASDQPQPTDSKKLIPMAILGVALVESAAIYALVIALKIVGDGSAGEAAIGAGLAIGLAGLGVSLGEGIVGTKAIEAGDIENLDFGKIMTFMILAIALVESAAIYGLIISLQILGTTFAHPYAALGLAFAIGLSAFGVGIGEGILAGRALESASKRPQYTGSLLTTMILGIALVESVAIYGLLVAMQLLSTPEIVASTSIAGGIAIGMTALGVGLFEGLLVAGGLTAMNRNPKNKTKNLTFMILFLALVEAVAIYGLFLAMQVIAK
ncbi:ATP synthase F0 subunit C [Candidatus Gracilibacteria bacterium]|nr:ATP synthase F0 subunit C [Candidatus Gracilibacteria bacterium]